MDPHPRYRGAILGLAVGDAVGTAVEFHARGSFKPLTDMTGGGPFALQAGEWTDDTSMALCLGHSLVAQDGFDAGDQMARYYRWYRQGYMSSNGRCFDIGGQTEWALQQWKRTDNPFSGSTDPKRSGNGGIMRLAPVVLFYHPDVQAVRLHAVESSRTTHGSPECLDAATLLAEVIDRALGGATRAEVLLGSRLQKFGSASIQRLARGEYQQKDEASIRGTGYVVDSLEAALWCFWRSGTYQQAILLAANLGDDADTTAAVTGQVAGAYYGEEGIPNRWLEKLVMREEIRALADALYDASVRRTHVGG